MLAGIAVSSLQCHCIHTMMAGKRSEAFAADVPQRTLRSGCRLPPPPAGRQSRSHIARPSFPTISANLPLLLRGPPAAKPEQVPQVKNQRLLHACSWRPSPGRLAPHWTLDAMVSTAALLLILAMAIGPAAAAAAAGGDRECADHAGARELLATVSDNSTQFSGHLEHSVSPVATDFPLGTGPLVRMWGGTF